MPAPPVPCDLSWWAGGFAFLQPALGLYWEAVNVGPGHGPRETETILLVDDESVVCGVGSMALQRHGYRVLIAKSGADGLRLFREHKDEIELVVSDISMPDMSGPDMVEAIRREGPHVSVLFIS